MQGLVLGTVRYGDKSVIANILTPDLGRQGFICGIGGKRGGAPASLMPLSIIEFEPSGRGKTKLQRLTAVRIAYPFRRLHFDPVLRSEVFFMAELLLKSVPDDVPDPDLFLFATQALMMLDDGVAAEYNFHLCFMMRLADYLGFGPDPCRDSDNGSPAPFFDLQAGMWTDTLPLHRHFLDGHGADIWHALQLAEPDSLDALRLSRDDRQTLIGQMTDFYKLHHPGFSNLKSQEVLASLSY